MLGALVLCGMSHSATWRDMPRISIDHAVAAEQWTHRTDDLRLRAYAANTTARAYAADGQPGQTDRAVAYIEPSLDTTEVDESARRLGDAGEIAVRDSSLF